ncbi:hypothetical protein SAPIO_CDS10353 [Scedosporium apiospermum]|uniref:Cell wall protein n=1 Tax=Pseudallescheria apiosperma TaxID=563466 RepID=A0A084FV80_PSEDA|nr:uncharacterized protein SAPIO_CDS10353 [Scedosporium apiospermum]KEZ38992.1 hypothetical protein SAPIO_CDS10353 [Scedosporium apiospermum]
MHFYTALVLLSGAAFTSAATIQARQNFACTAARVRILGALNDADTAIEQIQDPATQASAAAALEQAQGGVQEIAQAILAGQTPPASGRSEVEAGLTALGQSLSSANSADSAVLEAQEALDDAVAAGQDVVARC